MTPAPAPLPRTMQAVVLRGHGGLEQLEFRDDVAVPAPATDEVLIRVSAAALNNTDINTRVGWYSKTVAIDTASLAGEVVPRSEDPQDGNWSGQPFRVPTHPGTGRLWADRRHGQRREPGQDRRTRPGGSRAAWGRGRTVPRAVRRSRARRGLRAVPGGTVMQCASDRESVVRRRTGVLSLRLRHGTEPGPACGRAPGRHRAGDGCVGRCGLRGGAAGATAGGDGRCHRTGRQGRRRRRARCVPDPVAGRRPAPGAGPGFSGCRDRRGWRCRVWPACSRCCVRAAGTRWQARSRAQWWNWTCVRCTSRT